jgi:hypothetical protein
MPLLGEAAIAMWWSVAEGRRDEFNEWHSKEHLPERLAIPGFLRGSRWCREERGDFFVLYELEAYDVLVSAAYRDRLNEPTPWSTRMMPLHLGMVRSQCRVTASFGRGVATYMTSIRLSPADGCELPLADHVVAVLEKAAEDIGITSAHLLRTETPQAAPTTEQKIRGGDRAADWIILLSGHNDAALQRVCDTVLSAPQLAESGASHVQQDRLYRLVHTIMPDDVHV